MNHPHNNQPLTKAFLLARDLEVEIPEVGTLSIGEIMTKELNARVKAMSKKWRRRYRPDLKMGPPRRSKGEIKASIVAARSPNRPPIPLIPTAEDL